MRDEYNIRELNPSKNPYKSKVKVTIDVEGSTSVSYTHLDVYKRQLLCMVLTGAVMIGCMCTGTGAVDESNVVSYSLSLIHI